jgi:hypothetical protein
LEILADATCVPALRKTLDPALFGERAVKEQGSKIPNEPPQQDSARPEVSRQSLIDRAAQRLDWTIVCRTLHETPHGRDASRRRQGRDKRATPHIRVQLRGVSARQSGGGLEVEATALAVVLTTHRAGAEETEIVDDPKPCR